MQFRTRAIHGSGHDPTTGAVTTPVYLATTFVQKSAGAPQDFDYSRSGNPTRKAFESALAALEGGAGGLAFASGMAATTAATLLLSAGDHLLAGTDIYGGTYRLLHKVVHRLGIDVSLVNTTDPRAVAAAMTPRTKLVWIETPGNPLLSITDVAACAEIAHRGGALLAVDNTFATPVLTRPLELGADIVMHSATKYIGGHSDVLGGALVARERAVYDRLYFIQNATGGVLAPLDSYLCERGLKTLELRVREHCRSAMAVAEHLAGHAKVARVHYPGLASHPGHELAARQMDGGFGAIVSFEVAGDFDATRRICESTRLFQLAVSLGAVESLIEQPAAMSHASYDRADRLRHGIADSLIRLSIGLEAPEDLVADLDAALAGI